MELPPSCTHFIATSSGIGVFRENQLTVTYFYIVMIWVFFCFEFLYAS